MTPDRQKDAAKDLLWDYTEDKKKIAAFNTNFGNLADELKGVSEALRKNADLIDNRDQLTSLSERIAGLADVTKEYRELLAKNAERKNSLIQMGVLTD